MDRMRGVFGCALVGACSLFVFGGTLWAQEAIDVAPARREILEALQRALQPSYDQPAYDQPSNRPLALPAYSEAPPPAPVDVEAEGAPDRVISIASQGIEYELTIVRLASPDPFSAEEQAVTGETFGAFLEEWTEAGKVERTSRFRLSALNKEPTFVQVGEQVPVTTARSSFGGRGGGGFQAAVEYREVGILFGCTGMIEGNDIVVEVDVQESSLDERANEPASTVVLPGPDDAPAAAREENPATPRTRKSNAQTTMTIPDGGTAIVTALWTESGSSTEGSPRKEWSGYLVALRASILP